jgi:glutathione S-transferase
VRPCDAAQDGDDAIWESGAIVTYILEKYGDGRLQPAIGSRERGAYLQWFAFAGRSAAHENPRNGRQIGTQCPILHAK